MSVGISTEAILFFDDGKVVKEMLYPEFEAILDHVVGILEFESMQVPAAYVRINGALQVTHVVLFLLEFDDDGYAERSWNIPLGHLADSAGKGPDLGAGPIKLSCRSQCSVSWHQHALWDPDAHSGNKTLKEIALSAKRNRLGLTIIEDDLAAPSAPSDKQSGQSSAQSRKGKGKSKGDVDLKLIEKDLADRLGKKYKKEYKARLANLQEEHALRIATMKSEAQDHLAKLQAMYRKEMENLQETLATTKHLFAEEKHRNLQLKETLDTHAEELRDERKKFLQQMRNTKAVGEQQLIELEERFKLENKAKIDKISADLKEQLDSREVELFYKEEKIRRLSEESQQLRDEKQKLLDGSGDRILQRLVDTGITFVAYQPGVDHLTIPLADISSYLDSPVDYVADRSAVDKTLYKQWYKHYQNPSCIHVSETGKTCSEKIARVDKPARFIAGENDRCAEHSLAATRLTSLIKSREGR